MIRIKFGCILLIFVLITTYSFGKSLVHFSIDDVSLSLYDLTQNNKKYSTVFDQPFFRYLKRLNDKYGIIVSLYCFYEQDGFTLADCTDKYSKDFQENSSWLKFGYHAWSPKTAFNSNIINGGYEMFVNEIERITGTSESITSTVRLDYFEGKRDEILQVSSTFFNNGISALLCADSKTRSSYFLSDVQEKQLNEFERLHIDGLYFFETDFRFDDYQNFETLLLENKNDKELIVFTHEWLLYLPRRKNIIKYLSSLKESKIIKSNIENFLVYCLREKRIFVSDFNVNNTQYD